MFHSSSPNGLYRDYETRVNRALLQRRRMLEAQPLTGRSRSLQDNTGMILGSLPMRLVRLLHLAKANVTSRA